VAFVGMPFCFLVQNFADVDELWQKKTIFKMAAAAILNYKNFIFFGHVTVIGFNICCSIRNFIKVGRFLSRVSILTRGIDIANLSVCPSVRPSVCP